MSDKRTPHTDALETLGMIHFKKEARDAIHLAVEPVEADCDLAVGQSIGIVNGVAYASGSKVSVIVDQNYTQKQVNVPYHGIVDPFLPRGPKAGEKFWFIMAPRMVNSLRHVWEHKDFPKGE